MVKNDEITKKFTKKIQEYTEMTVYGQTVHCPYWMNKIKDGQVRIRGFSNGKGSASEIRQELIKQIDKLSIDREHLTSEYIRKLAKRNRIGIDCSGFVYRILNALYTSLDRIFSGGITKTDVKRLTSKEFCIPIQKVEDIQPGDLIRLRGGKHVVIILEKTADTVVYAHSSNLTTKIKGVHLAKIKITNPSKPIEFQHWLEKTGKNENFGKKFFHTDKGDGIFRLNIFVK